MVTHSLGSEHPEAVKYLEKAVECFIKADEKVIAAKISEDVVRLLTTAANQQFSDSDLIEKVSLPFPANFVYTISYFRT